MSERTVKDCDRCGADDVRAPVLRVHVNREPCPSGNGSNSTFEAVDLCEKCLVAVLNDMLTAPNVSDEGRAEWVKIVKAHRPRKAASP